MSLKAPWQEGALRRRAIAAARPGVEALLLAAVALGCAQLGWSVLAPSSAHSSIDPNANEDSSAPEAAASQTLIRSPFAPAGAGIEAASHAAAALLGGVQLAGVRMAEDRARSGVVLTMEGGAQRAFAIGQEIGAGVRITDIQPDYVLLGYAGGERQVAMAPPARESFADLLMGRTGTTAPDAQVAAAEDALVAEASADDAAWLAQTLSRVEHADGRALGWRVAAPLPDALAAAGLHDGDLVIAVNGAGPDQTLQALQGAASGQVELAIERGGERMRVTLRSDAPA